MGFGMSHHHIVSTKGKIPCIKSLKKSLKKKSVNAVRSSRQGPPNTSLYGSLVCPAAHVQACISSQEGSLHNTTRPHLTCDTTNAMLIFFRYIFFILRIYNDENHLIKILFYFLFFSFKTNDGRKILT